MSGPTPLILSDKSQEAIIQLEHQCYLMLNQQYSLREKFRQVDLAYIREQDWTKEQWRARIANAYGDPTKYQNVTVPIVMPQVEAAVSYQASVFLTGSPIFGWVAPPGNEDAALQFQAITEENSIRGGWVKEFMMWFRDGFKYNLSIMETSWDRIVTAAIETDVGFSAKNGKPKEVIWEGNCLKRWDPYNTFWDTRYPPTQIYKDGEFCGKTEMMSRVHLKKFISELPDRMAQNIKAAFESGLGGASYGSGGVQSYYIPQINPLANQFLNPRQSMDWMAWAGIFERPQGEMLYQNFFEVTTLYARIIPQDFRLKVPSSNTPQVWKFIIVNHQVLLYAERQTNAHNFLPTVFGQPNEDGLAYQTKSLADNATPFQAVGSALVNSAIASRRRAISDRGIYNPALVLGAHINSDSPTAKIPMRPAGYNKAPAEAYYPIPFRDDQSQFAFADLAQVSAMANQVNGQNQAKQGQFVKGNKTLHEYQSVMNMANGRDQMVSMLLEAQAITPIKEMIKINTLQFQGGVSIYSPSQQQTIKIDPVALRKSFVTYKITDGLSPTDKVISGDELAMTVQVLGSSPQLGAGYNIPPMFSYLMKTRNLDLTPFEKPPEQLAYEQAMSVWQQTVLEIVKATPPESLDPSKFPPQPKPQDFGYQPGAKTYPAGSLSSQGPTNMSQQLLAQTGGTSQ